MSRRQVVPYHVIEARAEAAHQFLADLGLPVEAATAVVELLKDGTPPPVLPELPGRPPANTAARSLDEEQVRLVEARLRVAAGLLGLTGEPLRLLHAVLAPERAPQQQRHQRQPKRKPAPPRLDDEDCNHDQVIEPGDGFVNPARTAGPVRDGEPPRQGAAVRRGRTLSAAIKAQT
jgi:hypothetical protein